MLNAGIVTDGQAGQLAEGRIAALDDAPFSGLSVRVVSGTRARRQPSRDAGSAAARRAGAGPRFLQDRWKLRPQQSRSGGSAPILAASLF